MVIIVCKYISTKITSQCHYYVRWYQVYVKSKQELSYRKQIMRQLRT